jgi:hypothetical protein
MGRPDSRGARLKPLRLKEQTRFPSFRSVHCISPPLLQVRPEADPPYSCSSQGVNLLFNRQMVDFIRLTDNATLRRRVTQGPGVTKE